MNYLSHFVFNHEVCALPPGPYFVLGVALPDLWLRYSRRRRIRWKAVRAARPQDRVDADLRAGLLNHVEVDGVFHGLPVFAEWQRALRPLCRDGDVHSVLADFLAHMAVELALDQRLLLADPDLPDRFYELLARCDEVLAAERTARLGDVPTDGLAEVIEQFIARGFLRQYGNTAGLVDVVQRVLAFAQLPAPPVQLLERVLVRAAEIADPQAIWSALTRP
jgi:hypothetical protein